MTGSAPQEHDRESGSTRGGCGRRLVRFPLLIAPDYAVVTMYRETLSGSPGLVLLCPAKANALVVTKYIDAASPVLFQSAIQGKRIAEATLVLIKIGGRAPVETIKVKLKDVVVTSVKTGAPTASDRYMEEVSLSFASAEYTYVRPNADQSAGAAVTANW